MVSYKLRHTVYLFQTRRVGEHIKRAHPHFVRVVGEDAIEVSAMISRNSSEQHKWEETKNKNCSHTSTGSKVT